MAAGCVPYHKRWGPADAMDQARAPGTRPEAARAWRGRRPRGGVGSRVEPIAGPLVEPDIAAGRTPAPDGR